jgi:putative hydrolase of the HAD superfamily
VSAPPYDVILFDLGGVLIELGGLPIRMQGAGVPTDEEDWRRWLTSPSVRRFESGRSTPEEFGRAMVEELDMEVEPDAFLKAFRDWPKGFFPGAEDLLQRLSGRYRVACLSNCNPLHWRRFHEELRLADLFDHRFGSHLIGSLKPDHEVFEHVIGELRCPPERVVFLDDNQVSVDAARQAGLSAHRALGVAGAERALVDLRVL